MSANWENLRRVITGLVTLVIGICPECAALLFPGVKLSSSPPTGGGKAAP